MNRDESFSYFPENMIFLRISVNARVTQLLKCKGDFCLVGCFSTMNFSCTELRSLCCLFEVGREVELVEVGDRVWSVADIGAEGQDGGGEGTMRQFVVTEASRVFRRPQVRTVRIKEGQAKGGELRILHVRINKKEMSFKNLQRQWN